MAEERQNGHGDGEIIEIEALVSSMEEMMPPPPGNMYTKASIFKTPEILFRHNSKAYLPNAFSIGPFHHGRFPYTEQMKLYYLQGLLSRAPTPQTNLKDLIESIAELEGEARGCYASTVDYTKQEFTKMLVIDGCFIIELCRKRCGLVRKEVDDPVLNVSSMRQCVFHDLLLLENQIPWLVLRRLYSMTTINTRIDDNEDKELIEIVTRFFWDLFSGSPISPIKYTSPRGHILYMFRETLILSSGQAKFMTGRHGYTFDASTLPSATRLMEAGVKIRQLGSSSSMLDIKFDKDKGIMEITPFLIHDITEAILRNMISFEQCYSRCHPFITCYLMLLDDLIDTSKDLHILRDRGIVTNCWLDAEEATQIFNGIHNNTYVNQFYYTDLCREVNTYCKRKWPRWRAMYMRNYFGTPWAIASQVLAALLLIFAFLQTFFTIKS